MSKLAIIPARSGSKRIPKKNIKNFLGEPIISYSIKAALNSELFDEIMVSTDSDEIAKISESFGAKIPFLRCSKNSDDHAGLFDVAKEVIERYRSVGKNFDEFCLLLATAPFVEKDLLKKTFKVFYENSYDSLFPVVRFSYPIYRALEIKNNKINMIWPEHLNKRSQDLPVSYHDAGLFYWARVNEVLEKDKIFTDNSFGYEISEMVAQDIDTEEDWKIAEFKYRYINK